MQSAETVEVEETAKPKKTKDKKPLGPKTVEEFKGKVPAVGDNSGAVPVLSELMDETLVLDEKVKELMKAKRDIRNRAKTEFNIMSENWNYEVKMRKKDRDVRIQFESGVVDLKKMLGYQIALDLQPNTIARTEEELADPSAPRDAEINRIA